MKPITIAQIQALVETAKSLPESGHPFLDRRWREPGADGRNIHYRRPYYRFCMLLARTIEPQQIVELGIDEGDCCGHWAFGAPSARVLGVDVHKDGETPSLRCREVARHFSNFTYHRGWSWQAVRDLRPSLEAGPGIDILFIDSWHEYDYFARDWNDWSPYLKPDGIVIVDDLQMGDIAQGFMSLPGEKFSDATMNPAVPLGVMLRGGVALPPLPFKTRDFMT